MGVVFDEQFFVANRFHSVHLRTAHVSFYTPSVAHVAAQRLAKRATESTELDKLLAMTNTLQTIAEGNVHRGERVAIGESANKLPRRWSVATILAPAALVLKRDQHLMSIVCCRAVSYHCPTPSWCTH